ncbi:phosphonate ABC transporter substrate-binding protein [Methylobacterium sp. Leaf104]|uniref:phosphonate ABC transporter substrate-binding protein n=1 Tax=Methylobacterium TaxID=407 RepID=UPI0006F7E34A|nr:MULTISPECIES: phosphonate ABC transporter substrate-binding protein [Methylobacterium]KQP41404.1 phosphonate ABC transporter substrate-binding protein [Methylobacterium sp. Leaf104]MCI9881626.1 phosphonate ABC transporter substrate-binding protein [Methylobacterium goesingense]
MLTRRSLAGAFALALLALPAAAQDWKAAYPELTLAVIPAENASGTADRYAPMTAYLSKTLGVPVKLRIANDYAAVIESQRAGNAQLAFYGPASFARAVMTGVKIEPIVNQRHDNGASGYYSVIYVRADSPYRTIEDLKGKNLALVDPNSTSGNQAPRFFLHKAGHPVDTVFGKTVYAGSHENAVLALVQGTVDAAANLYNSDTDTMVTRMATKGMLKKPDGTAMGQSDFRVVFKSDFLPEGPFAMLASLPDDLKAKIRDALVAMPKADKAAFDRLSDGKDQDFTPVTLKDYQPIIEMLKFNDDQRRKS